MRIDRITCVYVYNRIHGYLYARMYVCRSVVNVDHRQQRVVVRRPARLGLSRREERRGGGGVGEVGDGGGRTDVDGSGVGAGAMRKCVRDMTDLT